MIRPEPVDQYLNVAAAYWQLPYDVNRIAREVIARFFSIMFVPGIDP